MLDNDIHHTAKCIVHTITRLKFGVICECNTESSTAIFQQKKICITTSSISNRSRIPGQLQLRFHLKPDCGNVFYHTQNRAHWKWAGFTPNTQHFNITTLPPIEYLSSDRIMT